MMTMKSYESFADHIQQHLRMVQDNYWEGDQGVRLHELAQMVRIICLELGKDNPHFNRAKFLEACGLGEE